MYERHTNINITKLISPEVRNIFSHNAAVVKKDMFVRRTSENKLLNMDVYLWTMFFMLRMSLARAILIVTYKILIHDIY